MLNNPADKYEVPPMVENPKREWPSKRLEKPPIWCSVDLRDGNQALVEPMDLKKKLELFQLLVRLGFKEIEVGFPSASEIEFHFIRYLIERNLIPRDVSVQVLTQAREPLIRRTFEAIRGARQAIVHLYNSTSVLQRRIVFQKEKPEIVNLAVEGTKLVRDLVKTVPQTKVLFEYSPESFSGTEIDFAVEVCEAVMEVWQPTDRERCILNLPATVEMSTPNIYADQIECFMRKLKNRQCAIISLHAHNDRGCAVAATELGLLAGADRVEGTLMGNGERTGNVDIVTLALNMYSQGIHPQLDLSNIMQVVEICERCTNIPVHLRHPYAGELVFTAFSGSHQDAINKGMHHSEQSPSKRWEVPYLPIDPQDIGRTYEGIVRINSQSGKGGVSYVMDKDHGFKLPKAMQIEFSKIIQALSEKSGSEISSTEVWDNFYSEYIEASLPLNLEDFHIQQSDTAHHVICDFSLLVDGVRREVSGKGNGPINAFKEALEKGIGLKFEFIDYSQHALSGGADASAVSYVSVASPSGCSCYGVGIDSNITFSGLKALLSALNRLLQKDPQFKLQAVEKS